jgi:hypothetical protein
MRTCVRSIATAVRRTRRPLVWMLASALLFELSLLAGVLASPLFRDWMPRHSNAVDDATALVIHWRQSLYHRDRDPQLGMPAPRLSLGGSPPLSLAALRGKKVALLFARDGSG